MSAVPGLLGSTVLISGVVALSRMKALSPSKRVLTILISLLLCSTASILYAHSAADQSKGAGLSCTTFMATDGHLALLGDSEDAGMNHPLAGHPADATVFFRIGAGSDYGRMHLGWLWQGEQVSFQAGMNDQGLAYALTAVPNTPMNPHPERPFTHGRDSFYDRILREAATVDEAIQETMEFDFTSCWFQIQFADASGQSAILSPGSNGEFAITRKAPDESALVASTFNTAEPDHYIGKDSFRRYTQASAALEKSTKEALSLGNFTKALRAVDRHGPYLFNQSYTMYSTIYNLTGLEATIYVLSCYESPIMINLREALKQGSHQMALRDFIPSKQLDRAIWRYWITQIGSVCILAITLPGGIAALVIALRRKTCRKGEKHAC